MLQVFWEPGGGVCQAIVRPVPRPMKASPVPVKMTTLFSGSLPTSAKAYGTSRWETSPPYHGASVGVKGDLNDAVSSLHADGFVFICVILEIYHKHASIFYVESVFPGVKWTGGAGGARTPYLLNAIEALSQLSYSPTRM